MVCLALELVGPWVVLGFSVGLEAFDELLSINVPWCRDQEGRRGSDEVVPGPSVFPSGEPGVSGDFWARPSRRTSG